MATPRMDSSTPVTFLSLCAPGRSEEEGDTALMMDDRLVVDLPVNLSDISIAR